MHRRYVEVDWLHLQTPKLKGATMDPITITLILIPLAAILLILWSLRYVEPKWPRAITVRRGPIVAETAHYSISAQKSRRPIPTGMQAWELFLYRKKGDELSGRGIFLLDIPVSEYEKQRLHRALLSTIARHTHEGELAQETQYLVEGILAKLEAHGVIVNAP